MTVARVARRTPDELARIGGLSIARSGYGSAMARVPGTRDAVWLLTDRGPNLDAPEGNKTFPVPTYAPRIYRARLEDSALVVEREVLLRRRDGTPLTGLPIEAGRCGATGERAFARDGRALAPDPRGLDPEGLVALPGGGFWVSDEYGPFLVHFDADGRELERLGPCDGGLPAVYRLRQPNLGMEGLTLTPDGEWLVGAMQAPLHNPTADAVRGDSRATRILFRHLVTGAVREYLYLLERADLEGVSEILALSDTRFLVLERDDRFPRGAPPATFKRIYEIDVSGATDIAAPGALGARPIGGRKTLEQAAVEELAAAGIVPVTKRLAVDLLALGFPHDKAEGLALGPEGTLLVSNDDDFGIGVGPDRSPIEKRVPATGARDASAVWQLRVGPP